MSSTQTKDLATKKTDRESPVLRLKRKAEIRRRKRIRKLKRTAMLGLCSLIIIGCVAGIAKLTITEDLLVALKLMEPRSIYEGYTFYKEEYEQRYVDYNALNPIMPLDEVVWKVNANQDMPKYGYDILVTEDDIDVIVNKYYRVPDTYEPANLVKADGYYMRSETADAYTQMKNDAKERNLTIKLISAYRSVEYQKKLYDRYLTIDPKEEVDRYSARPGYSEHHTGLALDIYGSAGGTREFKNTPEFPWVRDNCYKYGFIIRYLEETEDITGYESEPWHLRYVGVDISTDMKEKNITTFEEYHAKYLQ